MKEEERVKKAEIKEQKTAEREKRMGAKRTAPSLRTGTLHQKKSKPTVPASLHIVIDASIRCSSFGKYEDDVARKSGAVWVSCSCGRWLHEDHTENSVVDEEGKE